MQCELRLGTNESPKLISVSGNGKSITADYQAFDRIKSKTQLIYIIDTAAEIDADAFQRLKNVIIKSVKPNSINFGVFGFGKSLLNVAPMATSVDTIKLAINGLGQKGNIAEGYKSIYEVVSNLKAEGADRRLMVLLADDKFDDTAYPITEIIEKLKKLNINVIAVNPYSDSASFSAAQSIRRLASETNGDYITAQSNSAADAAAPKIVKFYENGGYFQFSPLDKTTKILVELADNKKLNDEFKYDDWAEAKSTAPDALVGKDVAKANSVFGVLNDYYAKFRQWFDENYINKIIAIVGLLMASLIFVVLPIHIVVKNNRNKRCAEEAARNALNVMQQALKELARLDFFDGLGSYLPIVKTSSRIGRHENNDLVLKNTSVHREHAVLSRDNEGHFVIIDLNTENGVYVIGERVGKCYLQNGDIIELGEVRMKFKV